MFTTRILSRLVWRMSQDLRGTRADSEYRTEREIIQKRLRAMGLGEEEVLNVYTFILDAVTRSRGGLRGGK